MVNSTKRGRPAKVSSSDIAEAALKIGWGRANIRNVAEALGMSVPGLYHHVRTQEDLNNLVDEVLFARIFEEAPPHDSFEDLMLIYARRYFREASDHPYLIQRSYLGQGLLSARTLAFMDALIRMGRRGGLTAAEAMEIFEHVIAATIGAAAIESAGRERSAADTGFRNRLEKAVLATDGKVPHLRKLMEHSANHSSIDPFETVMLTIRGLREKFGRRFWNG